MAKIRPQFKAPGMPAVMRRPRTTPSAGSSPIGGSTGPSRARAPAQFAFLYVDRPELVEDFLNPPEDAGKEGVARIRYKDKDGQGPRPTNGGSTASRASR